MGRTPTSSLHQSAECSVECAICDFVPTVLLWFGKLHASLTSFGWVGTQAVVVCVAGGVVVLPVVELDGNGFLGAAEPAA
jgi:hypothetical protein